MMNLKDKARTVMISVITKIKKEFKKSGSKWASPTFDVRAFELTQRGWIGERFAVAYAIIIGLDVNASKSEKEHNYYDVDILKGKLEVKMASIGTKNDIFQFNGITDRKYTHLLVIGIAPHGIYFDLYNKSWVKKNIIGRTNMAVNTEGTFKYSVNKKNLKPILLFYDVLFKVLS